VPYDIRDRKEFTPAFLSGFYADLPVDRKKFFTCSLLLNYFLLRRISKSRAPKEHELLAGIVHRYSLTNPQATLLKQTKDYDPVSSDSSSGGSGGSSGGGGGSSGSSGGHSF